MVMLLCDTQCSFLCDKNDLQMRSLLTSHGNCQKSRLWDSSKGDLEQFLDPPFLKALSVSALREHWRAGSTARTVRIAGSRTVLNLS